MITTKNDACRPASAFSRHGARPFSNRLLLTLATVLTGLTGSLFALEAPTNLRTAPSEFFNNGVTLSVSGAWRWDDNASTETGYEFEMSTDGINFSRVKTVPANTQYFEEASVPWNTVRWFRVRAYNQTEFSPYSNTNRLVGVMPPAGLRLSSPTASTVVVSWQESGSYTTGYKVQRDTTSSFSSPALTSFPVAGQATTSFTDSSTFLPNVLYYYRVLSICAAGDSAAYEKPYAYLAVAPNGPPTPPIFITFHTINESANDGASATTARLLFDDDALNETGFRLERSQDNTNNYQPAVSIQFTAATRYEVFERNLLPNTSYYYRLSATNSRGRSDYTTFQLRTPGTPPAGNTTWYIDSQATGNSDGSTWANAWTSLGAINWPKLGPGHTIYISGGTTNRIYTDYLVTGASGALGNPITFRTGSGPAHGGKVIVAGQLCWKSQYVTIDGARNPGFTFTSTEEITNNINLEVRGRGDSQPGIFTFVSIGAVAKWIEVRDFGSPLSGEGDGDGAALLPGTLGPLNSELAYCWIHDNWGSGITQARAAGYRGMSGVVIHHNIVERNHNNFMMGEGSYDLHNNIMRSWKAPGVGHPDGIQGGIGNVRIWNNILANNAPSGSMLYPDLNDLHYGNFYFVNNLVYGNNNDSQFAISGTPSQVVLSNVVIANNTFYSRDLMKLSVVNNGRPNRILKAWTVKNNIFYAGVNTSTAESPFSTGGCQYNEADVQFNNNIICGQSKHIYYRGTDFANAEALNAATSYKNNTSATPGLVNVSGADFQLSASDSVAKGRGANLSSLANLLPDITRDIRGISRPAGLAWDIGAFAYSTASPPTNSEAGLMLQLTFENDFYSATNKFALDVSGNGRHGLRRGRPVSMTNYPTAIPSHDGSVAAEFHYYPNDRIEGQYFTGDYIAVTNLAGIRRLTNMTVSAWVKYYEGDTAVSSTIFSAGLNDYGEWRFGRDGDARTGFTVSTNGGQIPDYKFIGFPDSNITNQWHHYAVTWSGANHQAIAYYDGVPVHTNTAPTLDYLIIGGEYLGIGCWTFNEDSWLLLPANGGNDSHPNNGWHHGGMDDLRLYNRALSRSEIQTMAGGGPGPTDYNVQVQKTGTGSGTVSSAPAGLACGGTCSATFASGTVVTFTAAPAAGSTFAGWSGACSGTAPTCTLTVTGDAVVMAAFSSSTAQDTTPPTVAIATPAVGSTVSGPAVIVNAVAFDNVGVAGVQFRLDGVNLGAERAVVPYSLSWNTTTAANGNHTLLAVARDAAGNVTSSSPVTVTVTNGAFSINSGLALHFEFESDFSNGRVPDASGMGNDGIGFDLAHWPVTTRGVVGGSAALFSGGLGSEYVAVTNWNGIDVMTTGAISVWVWFTTNSHHTSTVLDAGGPGHPNSWRLGREQSENVLFTVCDSAGVMQEKVAFPNDSVIVAGSPTYATTNWHHYAVAWDGSRIVGYYDGLPVSTNSMGVPFLQIISSEHWMAIGCKHRDGTPQWGDDAYPSSGWMGGSIDDLRIYNRTLSAADVLALYRRTVRPTGLRVLSAGP